jgi:ABC-2 type transport system ATP-binding protein
VVVKLEDPKAGVEALAAAGLDAVVDRDLIRVKLPPSEASRVTRVLAERGLYLSELRTDEVDLETVFLELTGEPTP